jgi:simple sugar transport system permease protein
MALAPARPSSGNRVTAPAEHRARRWAQRRALPAAARAGIVVAGAFAAFALIMILYGNSPWAALNDMLSSTLGTSYGWSEVLVKMSPLLLAALAVTVPARLGLVNVGGEGQIFIGGLCATWGAHTFDGLPGWFLLPLMAILAFAGGGLWSGICGWMRAKGWLTEVFSTLLLNYLAILLVNFLVFGPWRDPGSGNYPQSKPIPDAAHLPLVGGSRVHLGIFVGITAVILFYLFLKKTRWGLKMRAAGGNPMAAAHTGIPVTRYIVIAMVVGGGLAGLAGMTQLGGIQFRLNPGLGAYIGYTGFLISWLAGHRPLAVVPMAFLFAVLAGGGDILQITQAVPYAVVNVLFALSLCLILVVRAKKVTT